MSVLCLTGWQQPADALKAIAPGAVHFDYAAFDDCNAMFTELPKTCKLAIGWSLGGQMLLRAVAGGFLKAQHVMLLATPYEAASDAIATFREFYRKDPQAALTQFNGLLALGDRQAQTIARALNKEKKVWKNGLYWLDELQAFSCETLDFHTFQSVTLVHGTNDNVIKVADAERFAKRLPHVNVSLWDACGHVPHLHDAAKLRAMVDAYV